MNAKYALSLALLALLLAACSGSSGSYFAPTAAVVCTEISCNKIPDSMIAERLQEVTRNPQQAAQFRGPQGEANRLEAKRQILRDLILDEVSLQQARIMGITASTGEVNVLLERLKSELGGDQAFRDALKNEGYTNAQIMKFLREQVVLNKVVQNVSRNAYPTAEEVADYYNLNKSQFDNQVRAAHILVCENFDAGRRVCNQGPNDERLANDIAARARSGQDFAALAQQFSKDPETKDKGGDLGFFARGDLLPEVEEAAFNLFPNEISNPVKTGLGFHVIKVLAIGKPFEEARAQIEEALRRQQVNRAFQGWLVDAVKKSRIKVNPELGRFDKISQNVVAVRPTTARQAAPAAP
ncbi:MAG: peptidylprolyl isomerase [Actinomycetota bacterium]|nr:peptidylprolyl isomerase [Actinomycetota bacterium]